MNKLFIDNKEIYVITSIGNKSNHTLIFVHGNSQSSRTWYLQLNSDLLKEFNLIAFDLPGHGESSRSLNPLEDYTLPGYVTVLKKVIEALSIQNFILVGFSMGGHIAIETLPELKTCKGILILGTPPVTKPMEIDKLYIPSPTLSTAFKADYTIEELEVARQTMFLKNMDFPCGSFIEDFIKTDTTARAFMMEAILQNKYEDEIQILQECNIPVAVLCGIEEKTVNIEYLRTLPFKQWRGGLQVISDASHAAHCDQPEEFNQLVYDFAKDIFKIS